ncbi:MAG: hypothetical protein PHQ23_07625 [Candidatus Wallbacteria bacterium]|nr:hypothetical protein [Candidatus Wallbacteria bacterium]
MDERILNLIELNRRAIDEINRFKWLESEKQGCDIGDFNAAKEWIIRYYSDWLRGEKQKLPD